MPSDKNTRKAAGDIIDDVSRRARILSEKCDTCIFRPGNPMSLREGKLQEIIRDNVDNGALLTCHKTLPYGDNPFFGPAACRGFWDSHGHHTIAGIIAQYAIGIIEVAPPEETVEQHQEGEAEPGNYRHEREEGEDPA